MIAVDTNVLVYAHRRDSEWHESAAATVKGLAEGREPWAIPWPCAHEFLEIATHPRIYRPPTTAEAALRQLEAWTRSPSLVLLAEGPGYTEHLGQLVAAARVSGARVHDARVAALCLYHGVRELWTADRDFSRFPELSVRNPLVT
jgi:toxin-antitoxin system PIN domain toxin